MEDIEMDPEMAALMGFSSFGKKRKFESSPEANRGPEASGANSAPLGVRPKISAPMGHEKIDLELSEPGVGVGVGVGGNVEEFGEGKGKGEGKKKEEGGGSGLADFLSRGKQLESNPPPNTLPPKPSTLPPKPSTFPAPPRAAEENSTNNPNMPNTPAADDDMRAQAQGKMLSFGGPVELSQQELYALRQGISNEYGDMVVFLPSFVEDPWRGLV
ncbi:hypothetical protein GQ43DRAFT_57679 [Delitschia confertaspora ATCC 74209]|uniref:Uncharacterized protein n=1 Tax=Delitschia confertaspora ATCC 74209 TaxID=1513339 RepID=A0A9P4MPM0_9PLEO|nr:hypothetical protein GQ43DRAFT_57679 [Delitschia confertaspora ATCC 74209]